MSAMSDYDLIQREDRGSAQLLHQFNPSALISDAEQRAAERQAQTAIVHQCSECGCGWCGKLPAMAPVPPKCVGSDADHKGHAMFWRLYAARQPISAELSTFADRFEDQVNRHLTALEGSSLDQGETFDDYLAARRKGGAS